MTNNDSFFNPFTYQPKVQAYFMGRPFPPEISKVAMQNPAAANHLMSIWQFGQWLNQAMPDVYNAVKSTNPALLDPGTVVIQGKLSVPVFYANPPKPPASIGGSAGSTQSAGGLRGMRGLADGEPPSGVITEWGKVLSDLAAKYIQSDQQKQLMELNIKLAEQGKPPVSSLDLATGNLAAGATMQNVAMLGLGALLLAGVFGALRRR